MSNIDKQSVQAVADLKAGYTLGHADVAILNELARIALASLEAEERADPVAFINGAWTLVYYRPPKELGLKIGDKLYTAPPAKVSVPTFEEWCKRTEQKPVGWVHDAMKEAYDACRAAMLQGADSNSPVIPDGWVACSERMPEPEVDVQVYCSDKKEQMVGYLERNEREGCFRFATWRNGDGIYCQPTHWMPLPAAPQQEAE
ncbi:DUF551 domain-containing protein [Enterobacter ludwigii]|uniref:DUF551 domain-containing protein n=1 Tax=Enterobacter ludwigii TaxID=299767 RepID=UPI002FFA792A